MAEEKLDALLVEDNRDHAHLIMRALVEQLEGILEVERGNGTTVAVSFQAF